MAEPFELERVVPVAAELWRRTVGSDTRASIDRAFKRDITVNDVWTGWVLDEMGIATRRYAKEPFVPDRVLMLAGDDDHPPEDVLDGFLARGGTLIVEGKALGEVGRRCGVRAHHHKTQPRGIVPVTGPAAQGMPDAIAPRYWAGTNTLAVRLSPASDAAVTLTTPDHVPLVQHVATRGGTLVHVACVVGDFRMGKLESSWAPGITPKTLAKRLALPPTGLLSSDEPFPEEELYAALTMLSVLSNLLASALSR